MQEPAANRRILLLDSCILEYLLDRYLSEGVGNLLRDVANDYEYKISEFVIYELIKGADKTKRERIFGLLKDLRLAQLEVTFECLSIAALLESVYKAVGIESASDGDRIIAATAILQNCPILTANIALEKQDVRLLLN